jgi:hypothetical protein
MRLVLNEKVPRGKPNTVVEVFKGPISRGDSSDIDHLISIGSMAVLKKSFCDKWPKKVEIQSFRH